jgi:hypothetical protein
MSILVLKIGDIDTNLLQAVFDGDKRAFESDIIMTKQTQQQKDHERDLLLAFWLAVHVENVELTHFMVKNEPLIKKLVTYLFLKQQHSFKRSSNLGSKSSSLYNGIIKPRANAYVGAGNRQFQKDLLFWTTPTRPNSRWKVVAVILIKQIDPSTFLQPKMKDLIDYFMLLVLCVSWLRFFSYFLVVRSISKLLLTLIEMIGDTVSFLFIVSCFILIMSSIFATLYQDNHPEKYGGLARQSTLFNGVVAQYSYHDDQMKGRVFRIQC